MLPRPPILDSRHALFLDFDGTLAPLQDDADAVRLPTGKAELLLQIAERRGGALALISGRDVRDLSARTPGSLYRIGNHGLFSVGPNDEPPEVLPTIPESLISNLHALAGRHAKAFVETKGPVATLHFRACPRFGPAIIDGVRSVVSTTSGYRVKVGNNVVEAIPDGADKGSAVTRAMQGKPFAGRTPVMVGDDTTDEDGFLAAQRLGGFGVKVGTSGGDTVARKYLPDVAAVWEWLREGLE